MKRKHPTRVNSASNRYLDAVLDRLDLPSDYALADVLGISTQAIYKIRGGGMMSAATAAKIAYLLDLDALHVIAETELERGSDDVFWAKFARKVAGVAVVAVASSAGFPSAEASPSPAAPRVESLSIMSSWRRTLISLGLLPEDLRLA